MRAGEGEAYRSSGTSHATDVFVIIAEEKKETKKKKKKEKNKKNKKNTLHNTTDKLVASVCVLERGWGVGGSVGEGGGCNKGRLRP